MSPGKPWLRVGPRYFRLSGSIEQHPVLYWCHFEVEHIPVRRQFLHMGSAVSRALNILYAINKSRVERVRNESW